MTSNFKESMRVTTSKSKMCDIPVLTENVHQESFLFNPKFRIYNHSFSSKIHSLFSVNNRPNPFAKSPLSTRIRPEMEMLLRDNVKD